MNALEKLAFEQHVVFPTAFVHVLVSIHVGPCLTRTVIHMPRHTSATVSITRVKGGVGGSWEAWREWQGNENMGLMERKRGAGVELNRRWWPTTRGCCASISTSASCERARALSEG